MKAVSLQQKKTMALTLYNNISGKIFYSCDFPDLQISTNQDCVDVKIIAAGTIVLSTTYYTTSGMAVIRNLTDCIESAMLYLGSPYTEVEFNLSDKETTISAIAKVLYCRDKIMQMSADSFIENCFITTNNNRLISLSSKDRLSFYTPGSAEYTTILAEYETIVRLSDETVSNYGITSYVRVGSGVTAIEIMPQTIQDRVISEIGQTCQLLYFVLKVGGRVCRFYVCQSPSVQQFCFINNFGCQEYVTFAAVCTSKLNTEFSEAKLNEALTHYDIRHERTFELQTQSLLTSQIEWLEQFVTSNNITKYDNGSYRKIFLREYTFENSDAPGTENTLTFTWQYANNRQTTHSFNIRTSIFSDTFTETFS